MFMLTSMRKKQMPQNTISFSFWISLVINHAYAFASEEDCRLLRVKAHEILKVAASLLFRKNGTIHQVLKARTRSLQSTFSTFYLQDVAHRHMDPFSINPVVVAHQPSWSWCSNFHSGLFLVVCNCLHMDPHVRHMIGTSFSHSSYHMSCDQSMLQKRYTREPLLGI